MQQNTMQTIKINEPLSQHNNTDESNIKYQMQNDTMYGSIYRKIKTRQK